MLCALPPNMGTSFLFPMYISLSLLLLPLVRTSLLLFIIYLFFVNIHCLKILFDYVVIIHYIVIIITYS